MLTPNIQRLAQLLYETYCKAVGGIAWNGDPLPSWAEFAGDTTKDLQVRGWLMVAHAASDPSALAGCVDYVDPCQIADRQAANPALAAGVAAVTLRGVDWGSGPLLGSFDTSFDPSRGTCEPADECQAAPQESADSGYSGAGAGVPDSGLCEASDSGSSGCGDFDAGGSGCDGGCGCGD